MSKVDELKQINKMCRMLVDEVMQVTTVSNDHIDMIDKALEVCKMADALYKAVHLYGVECAREEV